MTETAAQKPKPRSWALGIAGIMALLGLAALSYVVLQGVSKPQAGGLHAYAKGELKELVVLPEPPAQPQTPLALLGGGEKRLADWRGQVVLVNLWATWCAPCVHEMPTLGALQRAFPKDLAVVAISVDRVGDQDLAAKDLAKLSEGTLSFHGDPTYAFAFAAKAQGFPTTILYSKDGRELARLSGSADWSGPDARRLIAAALEE